MKKNPFPVYLLWWYLFLPGTSHRQNDVRSSAKIKCPQLRCWSTCLLWRHQNWQWRAKKRRYLQGSRPSARLRPTGCRLSEDKQRWDVAAVKRSSLDFWTRILRSFQSRGSLFQHFYSKLKVCLSVPETFGRGRLIFIWKANQCPTHGQSEALSSGDSDVSAHFGGLPEDRPLGDHAVSGRTGWDDGFEAMEEAGQEEQDHPHHQQHICVCGRLAIRKPSLRCPIFLNTPLSSLRYETCPAPVHEGRDNW